jgi:nucleoside-diphosphate-sugar epimerase
MSAFPVFRNRPVLALGVLCLSAFVVNVDATIVNVALPTLSRQLNADTAELQAATGFKPTTTVETGVRRFVDWYREYYGEKCG